MKRLDEIADQLLHYIVALLLLCIVGTVAIQIFARHVMAMPPIWTEEYARLFFAWLTFVGGILAAREDSHLAIEILYDRLKPGAKKILDIIGSSLMCALSCSLVYYSIRQILNDAGSRSLVTRTPTAVLTSSMTIGFIGMAIYFGINVYKYIKGIQVRFQEVEEE